MSKTPDQLIFQLVDGKHFSDRYSSVPVFKASGGMRNFQALVYECKLNLDKDGAPTTYGLDNPGSSSQIDLKPLEDHPLMKIFDKKKHKYIWKNNSVHDSQKIGLGNAAGDPGGDEPSPPNPRGWQNFLRGNRKFYWAGVIGMTRRDAAARGLQVDDRPELEAGLGTYVKAGRPIVLADAGKGYFPVIQQDSGPGKGPALGYFFSTTSATTYGGRPLDATVVPYAVWASAWKHINMGGHHLKMGDVGLGINTKTGAATPFVYGDGGTANKVGETSQKFHDALGGTEIPDPIAFIAFPNSGHGSALGFHPEAVIPFTVLLNLDRLGDHVSDLAWRIAMGKHHISEPIGGAKMTQDQATRYLMIMRALGAWTALKSKVAP
jgi:hypothetical protein